MTRILSIICNPTVLILVGALIVATGTYLQSARNKETLNSIIKIQKQTIKDFQDESYRIATGYDSWVKIDPKYNHITLEGANQFELLLQYIFYGKYPIPDAKIKIYKTTLDGLTESQLISGKLIKEKPLGVLSRQDNFALLDKLKIDIFPFVIRIEISSRGGSQFQDIIVDIDKEGQLLDATRIWHSIIDIDESIKHESGGQSENIANKYKNISPGFPKTLLDQSSGFHSWTKLNWEITDDRPALVSENLNIQ